MDHAPSSRNPVSVPHRQWMSTKQRPDSLRERDGGGGRVVFDIVSEREAIAARPSSGVPALSRRSPRGFIETAVGYGVGTHDLSVWGLIRLRRWASAIRRRESDSFEISWFPLWRIGCPITTTPTPIASQNENKLATRTSRALPNTDHCQQQQQQQKSREAPVFCKSRSSCCGQISYLRRM